jgi:outer membrane immunogenic protein
MRRLSVALIATISAVAFTQIASAADMPTKAPVMVAAPAIYNWTGFYVGVNAGGAWGKSDVVTHVNGAGTFYNPGNIPPINANGNSTVDPNGFTGGGQIGYNWQFNPHWVFGVEADINYFGVKGSRAVSAPYLFNPTTGYTINQEVKADWLFTARPRLGWAVNNWLIYVTGGLAVTDLHYNNSYVETFYPSAQNGSVSSTKAGWTVGGGVEYALLNRWSVKLEYLYVEFDNVSSAVPIVAPGGFTAPFSNSANLKENIVRAGLNYKFN